MNLIVQNFIVLLKQSQIYIIKMRVSNGMIQILKKVLLGFGAVILIITCLELVFIGKNITFSTMFTPQQSQQNHLRNESYITEAQTLIIFACILYVFLIPATIYSSVKHTKKTFLAILVTTLSINGLILFLNIYFLTGAGSYRNYMNRQYQQLQNQDICENNKISLCMVGKCVRLSVFEEAKRMAIAFTVIDIVCSIILVTISILINKRQKDQRKMELIV